MNRRVLKTVCAAVVFSAMMSSAFSQNYYIVVGAFASEKGDIKEFTSRLPENQSDTAYTLYQNENLFHFYLLKSSNREEALQKSLQLQQVIETRDPQLLNALQDYRFEEAAGSSSPVEQPMVTPVNELTGSSSSAAERSGVGVPVEKEVVTPKGKFFKFIVSTPEGNRIFDNVHYVDRDQNREFAAYSTNGNVDVLRPATPDPMTIVCGVFGYKEVEKSIDYVDPSSTEGAYLDEDGAWVIPYHLERLRKWDVSIMYNVGFYKDAAIMLPTSQSDLDELVAMMKSNNDYVIKVHGHCNSKHSRKIIAPASETVRYFEVENAIEIKGTAKQLTNYRAELVKSYLVEHGIDPKRIKTFGWGGSAMLVDENGPYAKLNDRIEIEILKD